MIFLINSFSLKMITSFPNDFRCDTISKERFDYYKQHAVSYIGNTGLANILNVDYNRESLKIRGGDVLLVADINGGRIPDDATTLPHNVTIRYLCVQVLKSDDGLAESKEKIIMEE